MSRERPLAPHRIVPLAVVAVLGVLALLALGGPRFVQRAYRPLRHASPIAEAAQRNDLDPYLLAAVINVESGFKPDRISPRGAVGLMQLMPSTAEELREASGEADELTAQKLKEPEVNIEYGARYLKGLVDRYDGDLHSALAAYNAGPSNADRWRAGEGDEPTKGAALVDSIGYPETKRYVREVLRERDDYERLYPEAFADVDGAEVYE